MRASKNIYTNINKQICLLCIYIDTLTIGFACSSHHMQMCQANSTALMKPHKDDVAPRLVGNWASESRAVWPMWPVLCLYKHRLQACASFQPLAYTIHEDFGTKDSIPAFVALKLQVVLCSGCAHVRLPWGHRGVHMMIRTCCFEYRYLDLDSIAWLPAFEL